MGMAEEAHLLCCLGGEGAMEIGQETGQNAPDLEERTLWV